MLHSRILLLLALLPACIEPALQGNDDTHGAEDSSVAPDSTQDIDGTPDTDPWTEPFVGATGPVDEFGQSLVPLGFVDDTHLLFVKDATNHDGTFAGDLALLNVTTKAVHPLGFGRDPFGFGHPRPMMASPDGLLWMFGSVTHAYLRNLAAPTEDVLDLGPSAREYAMNATGTIIVTLKPGEFDPKQQTLQVRRTDGSVIRGVSEVDQLLVSADRKHLFWVSGEHFFADDFDDDAGVVDAAVGPANDSRLLKEIEGGRYVHYTLPNNAGDVLYDVANGMIAMDTIIAGESKEPARDLSVINDLAVWSTNSPSQRVWIAALPDGTPEKVPNAATFSVLPHGLILVSADGESRFESFADGPDWTDGPDIGAWGELFFGPFMRPNGSVLMTAEPFNVGVARLGSWVDLSTSTLEAIPAPALMKHVPLFLGEDLFTYRDEGQVISVVNFSSGEILKTEHADPQRASPVAADDGRIIARASEGLLLIGPTLQPVVLATERPEFMKTRGDVVAFLRSSESSREIVVMRLPPTTP